MSNIAKMLFIDEGFREKPYIDSRGYPTGGIGIKLGPKGAPLSHYTFKIPLPVALVWADEHAAMVSRQLQANPALSGVWMALNEARRDALINMGFQLGADGTTQGIWGFRAMLAAVRAQDWSRALKEGRDSLWNKQTPERSERVLSTLVNGDYRAYERLSAWQR